MVRWFPAEHTNPLFITVGVLSILGVVLLVTHMLQAACCISWGQRLRYIVFLAFGVQLAWSHLEQMGQHLPVSYRHLGALIVSLMMNVVMVYSIWEWHRRGHRRRDHFTVGDLSFPRHRGEERLEHGGPEGSW